MQGHDGTLGRVDAGTAHDLANVLAVLDASAVMLEQDVAGLSADHPVHENVARVILAAARARELCERLRGDAAPAPRHDAFDLASAVRDGVALLAPAMPGITLAPTSRQGLRVQGRSLDALQVLLNLALNGAEAGTGRVLVAIDEWIADRAPVEIGRLVPGRSYARLCIEDDGPGLTLDEPFRAGTSGSGDPARGNGLRVVAEIVERAGGALRVGRAAADGARVEVCWPRLLTERRDLTGRSLLVVGGTSGVVARIADAAETAGAAVSLCLDPLDAVASVADDIGAWDGVAVLGPARGLAASEIEQRLRQADAGLAVLRPEADATADAVLEGFAQAWMPDGAIREGAA